MAEDLKDGSHFDLLSNAAEYGREEDRTVVHVKLTESSLRSIEEFVRNKRKIQTKPQIQFGEAGGKIWVPGLGGNGKQYGFQIQKLEHGVSSMEYVKYSREGLSDFRGVLARMGEVTTKLTVQAIEKDTMESAIQNAIVAEEQARKQCVQEIDRNTNTNVTKKLPQKSKRPSSLTAATLQSNHKSTPATPDPMTRHSTSPMKPLARRPPTADGAAAASVPPAASALPAALSVPPVVVDHPVQSDLTPSTSCSSMSQSSQSSMSQQLLSVIVPSTSHSSTSQSSQSSVRQPPRGKDNKKYDLSDVVIHMLAIRPLKKIEITGQLNADPYLDRVRNYSSRSQLSSKTGSAGTLSSAPLMKVLSNVARNDCKNNTYTLLPSCYSKVRLDWPFYNDVQVLQAKRNRLSASASSVSPPSSIASLSPCVSNVSSQGSPVTPSPTPASTPTPQAEDRQPAGNTETFSYQPPAKKQRIAHRPSSAASSTGPAAVTAAPPAITTAARNANVILPSSSRPSKSKWSKKAAVTAPDSMHVESRENFGQDVTGTDADYTRVYGQIVADEQRQRYKADFVSEYDEYMQLYSKMAERMVIFKRLYAKLRAESTVPTGTYEITKLQIMQEYHRLQSDSKYVEERHRCDYLHAKLSHIKSLVGEYDNQHIRSGSDS